MTTAPIEDVHFCHMNENEMRAWIESNLGSVNDQDNRGKLLLSADTERSASLAFVTCLVDEKGAAVNARNQHGSTARFFAKSAEVATFLLERGADPLVQDRYGWNVLMEHAFRLEVTCLTRLLRDLRVVEGINTRVTNYIMTGGTALHMACWAYGSPNDRATFIEMLLLHGANPYLRDVRGISYVTSHNSTNSITPSYSLDLVFVNLVMQG